jgi:2'-5' RNA ligase
LTGDARLFFAAWPAPEIQRALGGLGLALQRECGGRALPARNIHLTLVFLGDVARGRLADLQALAAETVAPSFHLDLDHVEYWRHNRVVWAGVARCPDALQLLVQRLEQCLSALSFRFDRRPYAPHVTLLRNARRAPANAAIRNVGWPVSRFALVESVPHGRGRSYEVMREWPLGA